MWIRKIITWCLLGWPLVGVAQAGALQAVFGNTDTRYAKTDGLNSTAFSQHWSAIAWKGEKINAQLLIRSPHTWKQLQVRACNLKSNGNMVIPASQISTGFVRYVLSDGLNAAGHGCGIQPGADSTWQADGIEWAPSAKVEANTTQSVWISIRIPPNTPAGQYEGALTLRHGNRLLKQLSFSITVLNHLLPPPAQWQFHLDCWQNPFAIARVHKLKPWSVQHFSAMQPYMRMLAEAGQKTITVSMIHDPWRGQTYDIYQSMIRWIKQKDGSWHYDYSVFDAWVAFMMQQGVGQLINCYTMVPWNNKFYYYDEALGRDTLLIAKTGSPEFTAHWTPMLTDFARHLKRKGWFAKTAIAMDERPLEDMRQVIALVRSIDKDFKISLAGSYHAQLANEVYDYCIASAETFDPTVLRKRLASERPTTFYTYCYEGYPNTFTFSPPAEAAWLGWYAANKGFNGYLRWAYNSWPAHPWQDARFSTWSSGDTYFVYPGPGSSIRFEKLIEGIQDYEKIRLLLASAGVEKRRQLEEIIKEFEITALPVTPAAQMLQKARVVLNK